MITTYELLPKRQTLAILPSPPNMTLCQNGRRLQILETTENKVYTKCVFCETVVKQWRLFVHKSMYKWVFFGKK